MTMLPKDIAYINNIMNNVSEDQWENIAYKSGNPDLWTCFSPQKEGLYGWLSFEQNERILVVNADYGAGYMNIINQGIETVFLEPIEEWHQIQTVRFKDKNNVKVLSWEQYNLQYADVVFDWIIINRDLSLLSIICSNLSANGKVVLNVSNKMGLSHWNGNPYESGELFANSREKDMYHGEEGYTKGEIDRLMMQMHLDCRKYYYPYPDANCPQQIYSDDRMLPEDEIEEITNVNYERYRFFDEKKAASLLLKDNIYDYFFEDFLVVCRRKQIQ